jgi:hypothetical protein
MEGFQARLALRLLDSHCLLRLCLLCHDLAEQGIPNYGFKES